MSRLEEELPDFGWREFHEIRIDRPPERVRQALQEIRATDIPLTGVLLGIRALPSIFTGRVPIRPGRRPLLEDLEGAGFVMLADSERELVMGAVGRFWSLRARPVQLAGADAFRQFDEPGYAKAAWNFIYEPDDEGTRLMTETRIQPTDSSAVQSFGRYWRLIQPGSGLIRRDILAALKRRARAKD